MGQALLLKFWPRFLKVLDVFRLEELIHGPEARSEEEEIELLCLFCLHNAHLVIDRVLRRGGLGGGGARLGFLGHW